ncbi:MULTISPECIES: hypothetical protein [unclassified Nostoc]|nr:hypothetical protein [Nostoc sp. 'Peltigera membranacea cyanobiont' 213]
MNPIDICCMNIFHQAAWKYGNIYSHVFSIVYLDGDFMDVDRFFC